MQDTFNSLPNSYLAYWVNQDIKNIFVNETNLEGFGSAREGMATANNDYFLKLWFEINNSKIGWSFNSRKELKRVI